MNRLRNLLAQTESHVFLFCIGLVVLNWPFLGIFHLSGREVSLFSLLVLWVLAIGLLVLIAMNCRSPAGTDGNGNGGGDD
jgi:hypothetical protein